MDINLAHGYLHESAFSSLDSVVARRCEESDFLSDTVILIRKGKGVVPSRKGSGRPIEPTVCISPILHRLKIAP
jgi:hypothetical protein